MGLKINKKVIYEVDHEDFNEFVKEKYGGDFEIVAYQELNNGSVFNVSVPNVSMAFGNENKDSLRRLPVELYSQNCELSF